MKQKQTYIILGAIGLFMAVFWIVILVVVVKNLYRSPANEDVLVSEVTLCDEDASNLCIVNFGANSRNLMVINFRLPNEGYAAFYVKAKNRDTVSEYTCEVDKSDLTVARCTGTRTPLGEMIDLEVYATDGDVLIARGTFLISAIAISTPVILPEPFIVEAPTAEEIFPTPVPTLEVVPLPLPDSTESPTSVPTLEESSLPPSGNETPPDSISLTPSPTP